MKTKLIIISITSYVFLLHGFISICLAETTPTNRIESLALTATNIYKEDPATGTAYIYYPSENETFYKPVVFVEGEDIITERDQNDLYALCNQQHLMDTFLNNQQTVILIDFDDTLDYVQNNAFLLIDFLKEIQKKSNDNLFSIIGLSAGGMIARYALTYMDNQSIPHKTRLLITIDTPHQGGNVPLGVQHWIKFISQLSIPDNAINKAKEKFNRLSKPFPKQMLYYYYSETNIGSDTSGPSPEKILFTTALQEMGNYPQNLRKVAISNGCRTGKPISLQSESYFIRYEQSVSIIVNAFAIWDAGQRNIVFDGKIDIKETPPFVTEDIDIQENIKIKEAIPYDIAPGSLLYTNQEIADTSTFMGDINTDNPYHSYVSIISALDIETSDVLTEIPLNPKSPFDRIYAPNNNQRHLLISQEAAYIILSEIIPPGDIDMDGKITLKDAIYLMKRMSSW